MTRKTFLCLFFSPTEYKVGSPFVNELQLRGHLRRTHSHSHSLTRTHTYTHSEGILDQSPTAQLGLTVGLRKADSPGHVNSVV